MEFIEKMESLLNEGMFDEFVKEVLDPVNIPSVKSNGMELITQVCLKGLNEVDESDPNFLTWLDALHHIVTHSNPKESFVGLIEQSVAFALSSKFIYLLQPMRIIFEKLPVVRASNMESILKHIVTHLKSYLEVPNEIRLGEWEGDETVVIEEDPQMRRIAQAYNHCLKLIEFFVSDYLTLRNSPLAKEEKAALDLSRREFLLWNTLIDLLGAPLLYFDLSWSDSRAGRDDERKISNIKTDGRLIAERIMQLLDSIHIYVPYLLNLLDSKQNSNMMTKREHEDDDILVNYEPNVDVLGIFSYFYLLMAENLGNGQGRTVYVPSYLFNRILPTIVVCFEHERSSMILKKGVALSNIMLTKCAPPNTFSSGLNYAMIHSESHKAFIEKIVTIIVYCKVKSIRVNALEAMKKYLWSLDSHGRYILLVRGFEVIEHSGLTGYLIVQLKDFIREALANPESETKMGDYFLGERLKSLLVNVCKLKEGPTTDLTDNSDRIISALNLVRYLLLSDGVENKSGFYSAMVTVEKLLLEPLRTALNYSKAHFEHELKELTSSEAKPKSQNEINASVAVDGKELPSEIPLKEKVNSMNSALSMFDMMTSLLVRVDECYSQVKGTRNESNRLIE